MTKRDRIILTRAERKLTEIGVSVRKHPRTNLYQITDAYNGSRVDLDVTFSFTDPAVTRRPVARLWVPLEGVVQFAGTCR